MNTYMRGVTRLGDCLQCGEPVAAHFDDRNTKHSCGTVKALREDEMADDRSKPTYENINDTKNRAVRSDCCGARVQNRYETMDTTAGHQIVYGCNACSNLYVVREHDEKGALLSV